jgi:hypothetical protein
MNVNEWVLENKDNLVAIPQCGGFYIVDYSTGVAGWFEPSLDRSLDERKCYGRRIYYCNDDYPASTELDLGNEMVHDAVKNMHRETPALTFEIARRLIEAEDLSIRMDGQVFYVATFKGIRIVGRKDDMDGIRLEVVFDVPMSPGRGMHYGWSKDNSFGQYEKYNELLEILKSKESVAFGDRYLTKSAYKLVGA